MRQNYFKPVRAMVIVGVLGLLSLASCQKSGEIEQNDTSKFVGDWKLADIMLVNAGDKPPRKLEELPRLNDLRFFLSPDGTLTTGNNEKGHWSLGKNRISLHFDGEESLDLQVSRIDPDFMGLEYGFKAKDGGHGGTVYYAFAK